LTSWKNKITKHTARCLGVSQSEGVEHCAK
jgi:hypothetical protein